MALNVAGVNADQVAMTYLVANTPRFLLRQLTRLPGFGVFVESNQTQDLIDYIRTVDNAADRTPESVGLAYTAVAALLQKEREALRAFLISAPAVNLVWVADFLAIADAKEAVGTTWTKVNTPPQLIVPSNMKPAAAANVTLIKLN